MEIMGKVINKNHPVYVVAEMSANHFQVFERAAEIVRLAAAAGADAVKVQLYKPETLTVQTNHPSAVIKGTPWDGQKLWDLYAKAYMPWEWYPQLARMAEDLGVALFATPNDETAVEFLEEAGTPAYKIASFDLTNTPLLEEVARTGKPVIVSTGMSTYKEIAGAMKTLRGYLGCGKIILLKCVSAYPAPPETMNLSEIPHMRSSFGVDTGLSDHTLSDAVPITATALGAVMVEKHMTIRRSEGGPDAGFSLEPKEFKRMVESIRVARVAVGSAVYERAGAEEACARLRTSLWVVRGIVQGQAFTSDNVKARRPATGLSPTKMHDVLQRVAARTIMAGTPLTQDLIR